VCLSDPLLAGTYDTSYPNLEDLAIGRSPRTREEATFRLCMEIFPKLRTFSFRIFGSVAEPLFPYSSTPPLLQHLELRIGNPDMATNLIELCAPTLQVLIFSFDTTNVTNIHRGSDHLVFPHLHSIRLEDERNESMWSFRAHTPGLRSYVASGYFNNVSFYTTEVRFLSCENPDLHHYPRLSILDMSDPTFSTRNIIFMILYLSIHDDICPLLEKIIMQPTFGSSVRVIPLIRDGRAVLMMNSSRTCIEWWMKPTFGVRSYFFTLMAMLTLA
jgi:hypothetical protein